MLRIPATILILAAAMTICLTMACEPRPKSDTTISNEVQQEVMERANTGVPAYQPNRYPARDTINRYLWETESAGEWYTYALNMMGEPLFYIVSEYKPMNICVSLTAPDRISGTSTARRVISAPALDGVYYGGAECNAYYMFDVATGGMIELAGNTFTLVSSRVPLFIETDIRRLSPEVEQEEPASQ